MQRLAILLLLGLDPLGGCERFAPEDATALEPPADYRAWWDSTEQCSGRRGDFNRVRWYVVPGEGFDCPGGRCAARWEDDHRIYLAEAWVAHPVVGSRARGARLRAPGSPID